MDMHVSVTIQTFNDLAEEYAKSRMDIGIVRHLADFFLKHLDGKKVLDIGCGPGRDAKYFAEHGCSVTGIDLAEKFLAIAARQHIPGARFLKMDMRRLAFPDNSFDGIWACASLHHLPKEEAKEAIAEWQRVLRSKGLLFVSVKEGTEEGIQQYDKNHGKPKFFSFYSKEQLQQIVTGAGFQILNTLVEKKEFTWISIFAQKT